jgi:hypothetical protein
MLFPHFREYEALRYVLQRPWWRRMWVTQEVVLSERKCSPSVQGNEDEFCSILHGSSPLSLMCSVDV